MNECHNCGKSPEKLYECSRCKRVRYCDKQCQLQARPLHRLCCTPPSAPPNDDELLQFVQSSHRTYNVEIDSSDRKNRVNIIREALHTDLHDVALIISEYSMFIVYHHHSLGLKSPDDFITFQSVLFQAQWKDKICRIFYHPYYVRCFTISGNDNKVHPANAIFHPSFDINDVVCYGHTDKLSKNEQTPHLDTEDRSTLGRRYFKFQLRKDIHTTYLNLYRLVKESMTKIRDSTRSQLIARAIMGCDNESDFVITNDNDNVVIFQFYSIHRDFLSAIPQIIDRIIDNNYKLMQIDYSLMHNDFVD